MSSSNRTIISILAIAALAIAFWMLVLGPKRDEADKLGGQVESLQASVTAARSQAAQATTARSEFPSDYRQLVVLGQAVPENSETSSLFVELSHVAEASKVKFNSIQLTGAGETATAPPPSPTTTETPPPTESPSAGASSAIPASATVPPTEAAASLLPLGATIGTAGLGVMPYSLSFTGSFFHIADFIKGIDSLVHTGETEVAVDGRLITLDGFALSADAARGFPYLDANFSVTTYLTPPEQGVTAGATATAPEATATPAATAPPESAGVESTQVSSAAR